MTYRVIFSESALRQLRKLDRQIRHRILDALEKAAEDPAAHVTRLVDDPGYRLRAGDWRAILDINPQDKVVAVIRIGHRRKVYG